MVFSVLSLFPFILLVPFVLVFPALVLYVYLRSACRLFSSLSPLIGIDHLISAHSHQLWLNSLLPSAAHLLYCTSCPMALARDSPSVPTVEDMYLRPSRETTGHPWHHPWLVLTLLIALAFKDVDRGGMSIARAQLKLGEQLPISRLGNVNASRLHSTAIHNKKFCNQTMENWNF
jgi:hypothetical protein